MRDTDRDFFERELASFLPDRIFDAHCHLWHADHATVVAQDVPVSAGYDDYAQQIATLHPGRDIYALFIPVPDAQGDPRLANQWMHQALRGHTSRCRGLYLVRPQDDPEQVRSEVRRLGLCGLKCYHIYAEGDNTWDADIPAYLPEAHVRVANEEGWVITLHLVKKRAIADPSNIRWIRHYCTTYPNMRLILAHSGRAFQPSHNIEALEHLADLDNLWFDSSANCEAVAHEAILRVMGHRRLMYGSDYWVSHLRGRSFAAGDSFIWVDERTPIWSPAYGRIDPVLVGLEHLRSMKWACWSQRLTDRQVEDVFFNNAAELLGVASAQTHHQASL